MRVEVLDLQGRVREAQHVDGHRMALDLSGYAQGTYFVRITGAEGTAVRKLVVR
ncbi:MAG: T9SS type A sorting domain-containing protein [Bacteroidales bacterium]|nr:T9SS type A sorting domain-containing protein [Bacteroidales bacterium]